MSMSVLEYTEVARALQAETARLGLKVPAFRAPCHVGPRGIKRTPTAQVVVYVSYLGRDAHDVTGDLIDGVLAAQGDLGDAEDMIRTALWVAAGEAVSVP